MLISLLEVSVARKETPQRKSPMRLNIIIDPALQRAFKARTAENGETMTDVLLAFIRDYVAGKVPPRRLRL